MLLTITGPINISLFTQGAKDILLRSRHFANIRKSTKISPQDILAAEAESKTPSGKALERCHIKSNDILVQNNEWFDKGKPALTVGFNENSLEQNFSSQGFGVLADAFVRAEVTGKERIDEEDLLHGLIPDSPKKTPESKRIVGVLVKEHLPMNSPLVVFKALEMVKNLKEDSLTSAV